MTSPIPSWQRVSPADGSFDYEAFDDALRDYVSAGSGIPITSVIPENEADDTAPKLPGSLYATVMLVVDSRPGWPITRLADEGLEEGVNEVVRQMVDAQYQVQFYRKGAIQAAKTFKGWAESSYGVMASRRCGFVLKAPLVFRRLDGWLPNPGGGVQGTSMPLEERAAVDMTVGYCQDHTYRVGYVNSAGVILRKDDIVRRFDIPEEDDGS